MNFKKIKKMNLFFQKKKKKKHILFISKIYSVKTHSLFYRKKILSENYAIEYISIRNSKLLF
jgi:hypothetical protein